MNELQTAKRNTPERHIVRLAMSYQQELTVLNHVTTTEAFEEFLRCCGSRRWAEAMVSQRPFSSLDSLVETANTLWWTSNVSDWFEAFAAHPKIGDAKALKEKFSKANSWEGGEQSGANTASEETLLALQQLNDEYHAKNGFIFLICATGKSADEMLAALRLRLANDRETEIQIAAGEQSKITKLRIVKLLQSFEGRSAVTASKL